VACEYRCCEAAKIAVRLVTCPGDADGTDNLVAGIYQEATITWHAVWNAKEREPVLAFYNVLKVLGVAAESMA